MKNSTLILALVATVVIVGGGYLAYKSSQPPESSGPVQNFTDFSQPQNNVPDQTPERIINAATSIARTTVDLVNQVRQQGRTPGNSA